MSDTVFERRKIEELTKQTADKIAAGEVVDRPLSIVKELVENSIDAGASSIAVEIKNGGKTYIRVTDNGCGVEEDELELAFKRHATSKLRTIRDLDSIDTLGFRGEALASIAAVSRTEMITRTHNAGSGTSIQVEGGVTAGISEIGCPEGTTLIVKDLFYNTPARLKFLKKDGTESGLIIDFMSKIALAYPDIRIRLINNGNTLFSTRGNGDMTGTIATVFDPAMAGKLIHFHEEGRNGLVVEGYISSPDMTRANRKNQIFFVNGRYIQSKLLDLCVSDGYRERLFEGRHPVVFLFIKIDPGFIDVNIHPNKREIRFDDEGMVRDFITQAIKRSLRLPEAVAEFTFRKDRVKSDQGHKVPEKKKDVQRQEQIDIHKILQQKRAREEAGAYSVKPGSQPAPADKKAAETAAGSQSAPADKKAAETAAGSQSAPTDKKAAETPAGSQPAPADKKAAETPAGSQSAPDRQTRFMPSVKPAEHIPFDVGVIRPVGVIFSSYILGNDDNCFYMIDQHAAHERIFYERLTREFYGQQTASQIMAIPLRIDVSLTVKNAHDEWIGFLRNIGFGIEEFGPRSYAVKEIPAYMSDQEAELFVRDFFDSLDEPGAFRDRRRTDKIITRACKSAVKANDRLDPLEISRLIRDLAGCETPFSCPHGRPTIIRMKRSEIEALFKR